MSCKLVVIATVKEAIFLKFYVDDYCDQFWSWQLGGLANCNHQFKGWKKLAKFEWYWSFKVGNAF